jgi:hypothetical protein
MEFVTTLHLTATTLIIVASMRSPVWPLALALLTLTLVGEAEARALQLSWSAPSGCPKERDVSAVLGRASEPGTRSAVRAVEARVGASYFFARARRYAGVAGVGANFQSLGGELRGCYLLPVRRVELPFCAGGEIGGLRGAASARMPRAQLGVYGRPSSSRRRCTCRSRDRSRAGSSRAPRCCCGARASAVVNLPTLYRPDLFVLRGGLGLVVSFD